jgi:two-component system, NtrC family, response regulator HydG
MEQVSIPKGARQTGIARGCTLKMSKARILIIDDEEGIRDTFSAFLEREGYVALTAPDFDTALVMLAREPFDLVYTDIVLGHRSGIDILKEIKQQGHRCPVIMITGDPNIETAAASVRLGAFDYIPKPIKREALVRITKHAIQHKTLLDEKNLVENLKEQYRLHLEAIFRSVEDAIITVDHGLRIVQANEAFERICGQNLGAVIGEHVQVIGSGCCGKCYEVLREALETKRSIQEYRIECSSPGKRSQVVVLSVSPLKDNAGGEIGAVMIIRDITRLSNLERELQERHQYHSIIGRNSHMTEIYDLLENLRDMDTTVLITGPSGTGKELVARAVHFGGVRAAHPFVVVNCSALAESLLESELFGHVKGAFTGAIRDKAGRFGLADKGTIFLDEIGDISPKIQLKLLRFLETREFERVGDSTPIKLDVAVITATNRDLKGMVAEGKFREDLYYRLKVVEVKLPALAKRRDDIPLLVSHYIQVFNNRFGKHIMGISTAAEKLFMEHGWPGNVRELIHTLEHAFVVCKKPTIDIPDLPPEFRDRQAAQASPLKSASAEKDLIVDALEKTGWNKAKAARLLGVSRQTIYRKVEEYDIRNL